MKLGFILIRERWAKAAQHRRPLCRVLAQAGKWRALDLQGTNHRYGANQRNTLVPTRLEPDQAETKSRQRAVAQTPFCFRSSCDSIMLMSPGQPAAAPSILRDARLLLTLALVSSTGLGPRSGLTYWLPGSVHYGH